MSSESLLSIDELVMFPLACPPKTESAGDVTPQARGERGESKDKSPSLGLVR